MKVEMEGNSVGKQVCAVCKVDSQQKKLILYSMGKKLSKQLANLTEQYDLDAENGYNGFLQLFNIIFPSKQGGPIVISTCNHNQYFTAFKRKLKCNNSRLNKACQILSSKIAEKEYQAEVLTMQIKNVAISLGNSKITSQLKTKKQSKIVAMVEKSTELNKIEGNEGKASSMGQFKEERVSVDNSYIKHPYVSLNFNNQGVSNQCQLNYFYPFPMYFNGQ